MNSVNLVGNLGALPEVKVFASGKKVGRLPLAINTYSKQKDTPPVWVRCELWDQAVECLQKCNVKAGNRISVAGSMEMNEYPKSGGGEFVTERQLYVKVQSFDLLTVRVDVQVHDVTDDDGVFEESDGRRRASW